MNIALITEAAIFQPNALFPKKGGVAYQLENFYKVLQNSDHSLFIFNPHTNARNIFKKLNQNLKINKNFFKFLFITCWKIFRDKQVKLNHRLKILFYITSRPARLIMLINNIANLYPFFKNLNIDIIIGGNTRVELPIIYALSRLFNKKVLALAHGNDFLIQSKFSFKTYLYKSMDKLIMSNRRTKLLIKRIHRLKEEQLEIIHYGLLLDELNLKDSKVQIRKEFKIPLDNFVLISIGRLVYRKKFDLVIKALHKIKNLKPNIRFKYFIIGDGPKREKFQKLVNNLCLDEEVKFLGAFSGIRKNKYYKLSDIFLMPSVASKISIEGFGIVFLEANYFKLPVIGSYSGGMAEAIINEKTGYLIKKNNLDDLVEKIIFLYENKGKRLEMGNYGHDRVVHEFNYNKIINDFIRLFKKILNPY